MGVDVLNKVAIFGVGLIGGSFALAYRNACPTARIAGIGRSVESLARAHALGLIDEVSTSVAEAVCDADLILLAAPVAQTEAILDSIVPHLHERTVITDAGSTKSDVVVAARRALGSKVNQFVPGHPIAGRESNGPEAAIPDLYIGKKAVLTPLAENDPERVEQVAVAWKRCGAIVHRLSPEDHDRIFAAVSHLPHLLAYALVDDIARKPHADLLFQYAASGFRDFTRIAGSSPEMWRDITLANQTALLQELDGYLERLQHLRALLARADGAAIESVYANAQAARQAWIRAIETGEKQSKQGGD